MWDAVIGCAAAAACCSGWPPRNTQRKAVRTAALLLERPPPPQHPLPPSPPPKRKPPFPRQDIVHEDLTVRENLAYSARLRLSAAKPAAEKAALVEDCVDLLQLRHVQHQVVGSVERRGIRWGPGGGGEGKPRVGADGWRAGRVHAGRAEGAGRGRGQLLLAAGGRPGCAPCACPPPPS